MVETAGEEDQESHARLAEAQGGEDAPVLEEKPNVHRFDLYITYLWEKGEDGFADLALEGCE